MMFMPFIPNDDQVPPPMQAWFDQLPSQCIGKLYATIEWPFLGIRTEHKVDVWGQVCDGQDHRSAVHCMLHNRFPGRGKGFTYVAWRAVPDHPEVNQYPRTGVVKDPIPFDPDVRPFF